MGSNVGVVMQKLANQTQLQLQKMVNSANTLQSKYNAAESEKARAWQTEMSKSAHQMEVEDLKKAGLNPVLSSGGSGAQSYTTSSASMTPESGASALAQVGSSQLGAIGSIESSRISAAATRAAAAQAAAATRAAAGASAWATKYAADMGYAKQLAANKSAQKVAKIQTEASKWISQNKQASTPWGLFDKAANALLKNLPTNINVSGFLRAGKVLNTKFDSNPQKYFANYTTANSSNFKLTEAGKTYANNVLNKMGIAQTGANRRLVVQAYWTGNKSAYRTLLKKVPTSKIITTTRPGWR